MTGGFQNGILMKDMKTGSKNKFLSKKAVFAIIFLLLLAFGMFAGSRWLDSFLNPANIAELSGKLLGSPLKLAQKPQWGIFPPRVSFQGLEWQLDTESISGNFTIPSGSATLELLPLLQGRCVISEASLEEPSVALKIKAARNALPAENPEGSPNNAAMGGFLLKKLLIRRGCLEISTESAGATFSNINLSAENPASGGDMRIQSAFNYVWNEASVKAPLMAGKATATSKFDFSPPNIAIKQASLSFTPSGKTPAPPLEVAFACVFNLATSSIQLSEATANYQNWRLWLSGHGNSGDFSGKARIALNNNDSQTGTELVSASALAQFSQGLLHLRKMEVNLPGGQGSGEIEVRLQKEGETPQIDGSLYLPELNFDWLNKLSSTNATGNVNTVKTGALSLPDMDLQVKITKLVWNKLEFADINMPFQVRANVASIPAARFNWASGVANATFSADLNSGESDLRLHADNLNMGLALAELGLDGISGGNATISGHLSATGAGWPDIRSSLSGRLQITGTDAAIPALQKVASSLPAFLNAQSIIPETVNTISAQCAANMGVLYCRDLNVATNSLKCAGSATLDLHDYQVNGAVRFKAGKLDLPITFKGPANDISWRPGSGFLEGLRRILP